MLAMEKILGALSDGLAGGPPVEALGSRIPENDFSPFAAEDEDCIEGGLDQTPRVDLHFKKGRISLANSRGVVLDLVNHPKIPRLRARCSFPDRPGEFDSTSTGRFCV
jgi:hypothetical protein